MVKASSGSVCGNAEVHVIVRVKFFVLILGRAESLEVGTKTQKQQQFICLLFNLKLMERKSAQTGEQSVRQEWKRP